MTSVQRCDQCRASYDELDPRVRCACGGLLALEHTPPAEDGASLRRLFEERWGQRNDVNLSGVWRYRELVLPSAGERAVTHPEGNTPLLRRASAGSRPGSWRSLARPRPLHRRRRGRRKRSRFVPCRSDRRARW